MKHSELAAICFLLLLLLSFTFSAGAVEMYVDSHFLLYLFFALFCFAVGLFSVHMVSAIVWEGMKREEELSKWDSQDKSSNQ